MSPGHGTGPVTGPLLPEPDDDSAEFWAWCARGELRVQACASCGRRRMPPRPLCTWCRSFEHTWAPTSGRGAVWAVAVPHPPLLPHYGDQAPYNVVVVALADDPAIRFVGNVVTAPGDPLDTVDPHTVAIGDPVRVVFDPPIASGDGPPVALPRWVADDRAEDGA